MNLVPAMEGQDRKPGLVVMKDLLYEPLLQ
jgi:hypothetical protein